MSRFFPVLLLRAILAAGLVALVATSPAQLRLQPMGDSLTVGWDTYTGAYRTQLEDRLQAGGYAFDFVGQASSGSLVEDKDHDGYNGITIPNLRDRVYSHNLVSSAVPHVIMLMVGTNDVVYMRNWNGDWQVIENNLNGLFDAIESQLPPGATVIARAISYPRYNAHHLPGGATAAHDRVTQYNNRLNNVVQARISAGKNYVMAWPTIWDYFDLDDDGVHFSDSGNNKLGDYWYDTLEEEGLLTVAPPPTNGPPAQPDLNGDGWADFVWRNRASYEKQVSFMADNVRLDQQTIDYTVGTIAWEIVGVGDFDKDGKADLLWRRITDGTLVIHYMDGANRVGIEGFNYRPAIEWEVKGVADFDLNGHADVLFRHSVTGLTRVHFMRRGKNLVASNTNFLVATMDLEPFVADFNADGRPDIFWRGLTTGTNQIYHMRRNLRTGAVGSGITVNPANWEMRGAADCNRDGYADLVFRNRHNGNSVIYHMMNNVKMDIVDLPLAPTNADWSLRLR